MITSETIAGGLLCSVLGRKSTSSNAKFRGLSRSAVIITSFFINIVAYGLIFINLPNDSPFGDTHAKSFIEPRYEYLNNIYFSICHRTENNVLIGISYILVRIFIQTMFGHLLRFSLGFRRQWIYNANLQYCRSKVLRKQCFRHVLIHVYACNWLQLFY